MNNILTINIYFLITIFTDRQFFSFFFTAILYMYFAQRFKTAYLQQKKFLCVLLNTSRARLLSFLCRNVLSKQHSTYLWMIPAYFRIYSLTGAKAYLTCVTLSCTYFIKHFFAHCTQKSHLSPENGNLHPTPVLCMRELLTYCALLLLKPKT